MPQEFLTFVRRFSDLSVGRRILYVKDLTPGPAKYDTRLVLATLDRESRGGMDILWVRSETGVLSPKTWGIRIIQELVDQVWGAPWSDVFSALKEIPVNEDILRSASAQGE